MIFHKIEMGKWKQFTTLENSNGAIIADDKFSTYGGSTSKAYMERLLKSYNACLPFENPESDIPKIINALNQLAGNHFNKVPWNQTELKVIVGKALALIKE
jgi:hypothetical protein